jgi:F0F1-type ATP synthase delta subunit
LYASVQHAEASARPALIDRFLVLMVRDRRRRDIPVVFRHVERIAEREAGAKRVDIVSAKPLSKGSLHALESEGKKIFGEEKIFFQQKIQPNRIGGAEFRTENETFDASAGGRLGQLKQFLEKSL